MPTPRIRGRRVRHAALLASSLAALLPSSVALVSPASASSLSNARQEATTLLNQINRIDGEVASLGQKYDRAQISLNHYNNEIANTKATVASIEGRVNKGVAQLRADAVFAYVTNGAALNANPIFSTHASDIGATNVYSQLAAGDINTAITSLKRLRIKLTLEKGILRAEDRHARNVARDQAHSYHKAKLLQAQLHQTLAQVKGRIATYVSEAEAAAQASSASQLSSAQPSSNFPPPPPDSKANIAVDAALTFLGVPYVWGGASRSGVDCSGLVMLAYDAAGIYLPHYSGAQYADTARVPLWDIQPGDLLFYGPGGDQHVAMYVGHGEMIEAPETGYTVHITPVRLYGGFVGLGRPR